MRHKIKRIHFVGIGGSGMSGIAEVLTNLGYSVSGSDIAVSATTKRLEAIGVKVFHGHESQHIDGADCVVTSSAVKSDNPEVQAAHAAKIPVIARAVMLAELMKLKQGIAIAGTHGKTTTTSLVASVLAAGGLDPTYVIGGRLNSAGTNARLGGGEFIVVEADESDASFLNLNPVLAVVTNIDADHMETYGHDSAKLNQAFVDFIQRLPFYGSAVLCIDDEGVRRVLPLISKPVVTYGFCPESQVRAVDLQAHGTQMQFRVLRAACKELQITLNLPGRHNVLNALAAIAIASELGVSDEAICQGLREFKGVGRRFQRWGQINGAELIDDYGHHPVEMQATLAAARGAFPGRRIVLAFQPHRFTRTRDLFEDFVRVLSTVDVLLLAEVYSAGESPIVAADSKALARALRIQGKVEPVYVEEIADMPEHILAFAQPGDVVITMGAGSIGQVAQQVRAVADQLAKVVQ